VTTLSGSGEEITLELTIDFDDLGALQQSEEGAADQVSSNSQLLMPTIEQIKVAAQLDAAHATALAKSLG
jgi:hypothetical protein